MQYAYKEMEEMEPKDLAGFGSFPLPAVQLRRSSPTKEHSPNKSLGITDTECELEVYSFA